jgi:diguanylate cyclase (GGDEF)-like protein/PAS domain S-box-containing protein
VIGGTRESLEDLIGALDAVVWEATASPDLRFTYVSPAAERILGHPVGRWLDEPGFWERHIHPDDRDVAVALCERAVARHEHHVLDYRWLTGDGDVVRIHDVVRVLPAGDGVLLRGVMTDITDRHETAERLRLLLENAQDCFYRIRLQPDLAFEYVSPGCATLSGRPPAAFYADPLLPLAIAHPDDRHILEAALQGAEGPDLFRYLHPDGRAVWVETRRHFVRDAEGRPVAIEGVGRDVTDQVRTKALFQAAFEQAPIGMGLTELEGGDADCLVAVNDALCAFLQRSADELAGRRLDDFAHDEDRGTRSEKRYVRPDGSVVWGALRGVVVRDPEGRALHGLAQVEDVTGRRAFEEELAHRALHDALTGLPNRMLFVDRVQRALAARRRDGERVAVLYVDVDDLKAVNDALGHAAGDTLLRVVGQRLHAAVRPGDTVARIAGDEFTVLCPDVVGPDALPALADRLVRGVREPLRLNGRDLVPTISVGVAECMPGPDAAPDELLADADLALMEAKGLGGGHVQRFDDRLRARAVRRRHTEAEIRGARERGELRLHYQPIVDLDSGGVTALEALLRWEHPSRGLLLPNEFIPLAERTGAITDLGCWVIEQACRDLARSEAGRMCVNLSARQLADDALPGVVRDALDAAGVPASALCFEVTETALVEDPPRAVAALEALRALGAQVAIDDFGTGYSSLAQLKTLPVDVLKIDRLFVQAVGDDERDAAVIAAVVSMAAALGLELVAEGIETEAQRDRLVALGCPRGQGFLFAHPAAVGDHARGAAAFR